MHRKNVDVVENIFKYKNYYFVEIYSFLEKIFWKYLFIILSINKFFHSLNKSF